MRKKTKTYNLKKQAVILQNIRLKFLRNKTHLYFVSGNAFLILIISLEYKSLIP